MHNEALVQTAKDYLSQIMQGDRLINRLNYTVQTLRSSLTSQSYEVTPDRVQSSGYKNRLSETVSKIIDLEADINRRIDELIVLKVEALKKISKISDKDQQSVLLARYIEGIKWEKIAVELNFSIAQVYRVHRKALLNFGKMIVSDS